MDWQLSKETVLERIQTLFKTSQWSDCTFKVEGQIFKAHRLILASCSPVFEAMCFGPLAEKACINVPDMEPDVFKILLEYIYTDSVKLSSLDEAGGVLYASKKYMLPHLSRICCEYLSNNVRPSNALSVFEFAEEIQEDKLMEACLKVMCRHAGDILRSPSHHISSFTFRTILDQNSLNISEASLFDAALRWAKVECQQRGVVQTAENIRNILVMAGILPKIRFLCLTAKEFSEGPEQSGILKADEICALQYALLNMHNSDSATKEVLLMKKEHIASQKKLPHGWSTVSQPRGRISVNQYYCSRRFLKTVMTASGYLRLLVKVQVDHNVLVSGVRFFTRLIPRIYNYKLPHEYGESIEMSVLDGQGTLLGQIHFQDKVEYNTLATITLNEPVRFSSQEEYSMLFVLPSSDGHTHEYPLSFMSQTENTRGIEFHFCDHADIDSSGAFVPRLDMGFVNGIVYSPC
ncbi:BTB/POZ domain-containing protein 2 [Anabrus simplex]|uniref:BTB/POZ domain-containing protein 2 n=1 Tax=Anabrus simplex TaxID=316456 RepID=UPI0034DD0880